MTLRTFILTLSLSLLAVGCGGSTATETAPAPEAPAAKAPAAEAPAAKEAAPAAARTPAPGDVAAGEKVYATNCVACHQKDGTGMGGALGADLVNDKTRSAKTNEQLLASISDGVPGTTMIAWSAVLDEKQRQDVLAYITTTFMK